MSGYLQRLVHTGAGRGDSVRPHTGSIFSQRAEERRAPLQGWEETEHVSLAQPPHPRAMEPEREPPEPHRGVTPRSEHAPLLPRSVASDRRMATEAPPVLHAVDIGSPDDPLDDGSSQQVAEQERRHDTAEAGVHLTVPARASGRAGDPFRPVMKPTRMSDAVISAAGPRDRARPHHGVPAVQQPDDIQIHIGRIEVVAVPPPAPRAPKTADRSLSLDTYLSRRDGRTR